MPLTPQLNDFLQCPVCFNAFSNQRKPFTLICSHTCCSSCLKSLQCCPFDQTAIETKLPENEAILGLIASNNSQPHSSHSSHPNANRDGFQVSNERIANQSYDCVEVNDIPYYRKCIDCIKQLALLLKPQQQTLSLSRPMQRKLITLLHCQIIDGEGRTRAMRNARSIGERALAELLIKHQDSHQLSSNLWAAVRARGCQFLGPAMQEEVLRLVLLALEDGSALSRKVLVMFVVQRLSPHFPHQASKTAIGHVIQLLYRASCFKLTKRDGDSSLMQLKEEYCSYEALRREHDTQIVSIALEAGLRISPDQWSSLLYGDSVHKSHMQSIIDKLQSPASFSQSIQEFVIALQRTGDPSDLSAIRQPLEILAVIDPSLTHEPVCHPTHEDLAEALEAAKVITFRLIEFLQQFASSHNVTNNQSNNRSNKFSTGVSQNNSQRQRVGRVRPLQQQSVSPQFSSDQFSALSVLSSPRHASVQQVVRPCASVPPSRIIRASDLTVSPTLTVGTHSILTQTTDLSSTDPNQQLSHSNTIHAIPVIVASSASSNIFQETQPIGHNQCGSASVGPTLPSEEDQMIPFSDRPFVSKYGPISRLLNLINTPTMAAPGNGMSQQLTPNGMNTCARTHPTNVILGRSAVPSLTLIQPLQILTTAFLTDPTANTQYGGTAFIADPTHYQSNYVSGLLDSTENQMNDMSLT